MNITDEVSKALLTFSKMQPGTHSLTGKSHQMMQVATILRKYNDEYTKINGWPAGLKAVAVNSEKMTMVVVTIHENHTYSEACMYQCDKHLLKDLIANNHGRLYLPLKGPLFNWVRTWTYTHHRGQFRVQLDDNMTSIVVTRRNMVEPSKKAEITAMLEAGKFPVQFRVQGKQFGYVRQIVSNWNTATGQKVSVRINHGWAVLYRLGLPEPPSVDDII